MNTCFALPPHIYYSGVTESGILDIPVETYRDDIDYSANENLDLKKLIWLKWGYGIMFLLQQPYSLQFSFGDTLYHVIFQANVMSFF